MHILQAKLKIFSLFCYRLAKKWWHTFYKQSHGNTSHTGRYVLHRQSPKRQFLKCIIYALRATDFVVFCIALYRLSKQVLNSCSTYQQGHVWYPFRSIENQRARAWCYDSLNISYHSNWSCQCLRTESVDTVIRSVQVWFGVSHTHSRLLREYCHHYNSSTLVHGTCCVKVNWQLHLWSEMVSFHKNHPQMRCPIKSSRVDGGVTWCRTLNWRGSAAAAICIREYWATVRIPSTASSPVTLRPVYAVCNRHEELCHHNHFSRETGGYTSTYMLNVTTPLTPLSVNKPSILWVSGLITTDDKKRNIQPNVQC